MKQGKLGRKEGGSASTWHRALKECCITRKERTMRAGGIVGV